MSASPLKLALLISASSKGAVAELDQVDHSLDNIGTSANRAGARAKLTLVGLEADGKRAALGLDLAKGSTANLASQFNDIGVMMAAGQSPLQLALQQGTQISQLFAGASLGATIRGIGSAMLSVISPVSLVTIGMIAGGAALFQWATGADAAAEKTKTVTEIVEDLGKATTDYASLTKNVFAPLSELKDSYGAGVNEARELLRIEQQRALIQANQATKNAITATSDSGFGQRAQELKSALDSLAVHSSGMFPRLNNDATVFDKQLGLAADDVAILTGKMEMLARTPGAAAQAKAIQDIIAYTIEAAGGVQNITGDTALWFDELLKIGDETAKIAAQQELNVARGQDMLATFQAQAEIAALTAQYGADSAQVAAAKLQAERDAVVAKVEALGLSEDETAAILKSWDTANNFTAAILASATATSNVVYGIGDITAAFDPAIIKAGQLAAAIARARAIPGMANPDPSAPFDAEGEMAQARLRAKIFVAPASSGRGGGGGAAAEADGVEKLIAAQERELALLRETDPVQKELLRHREAMEGATAAERAQLEQLITTRQQEEAAIKAATEAQAAYRDMAYGALEGLILKGDSFGETLGNLAGQLAKLLLQAALLGTGPLAGLFGGGGLGGGLLGLIGLGGPKADGGMIYGSGGPREDKELTPTSPGEYVVNAAATARNRTLLETINAGGDPTQLRGGPSQQQQQAEPQPQRLAIDLQLSEDLDARIKTISRDTSMDVTRAALTSYSNKVLPDLVQRTSNDPRARR